jgi:hypothetical protein
MTTQETPETFINETEGEETITIPSRVVRQLRAASYALGGLTVSQIAEALLADHDPDMLIESVSRAYKWTDAAEKRRLKEAKSLATYCGSDWEEFFRLAARMQPF